MLCFLPLHIFTYITHIYICIYLIKYYYLILVNLNCLVIDVKGQQPHVFISFSFGSTETHFCNSVIKMIQLPLVTTWKCHFFLAPRSALSLMGVILFLLDKVGRLLFCLVGHRHASSGPGQAGRVASFAASLWHSCLYIKVTLSEVLHSARLACRVLQPTWSIKHLNDNHSYAQTLSASHLCEKSEMRNAWACMCKYSFPLSL